jgi:signal transduction histidine kinase
MRFSVRTNTALTAIAILTVTFLVSVRLVERGLTSRVLRDSEEQWLANLKNTGAVIVAYVRDFQTAKVDQAFLQEYVRDLGKSTSLAIRVLDDRAICQADSRGPPLATENYAARKEVREALKGRPGHRFTGSIREGTRALQVALPVKQEQRVTGVVQLSRNLGEEAETARAIRRQLFAVTKWTTGLGVLLLALACWWLFRPLGRLGRSVAALVEAETPAMLPVEGGGDLAQLSRSINTLSARVLAASHLRAEWMRDLCDHLLRPVEELRDAVRALAEAAPALEKPLRAHLSEVVLRSERLARLMEDAAALERLTAGADALRTEVLNVREVSLAAVERVKPWAEHREVEIRIDAPPTKATFQADRERLLVALTHILENAVRFSSPGGEVVVEAWNDNDSAGFKVIDLGAGMAAEILPQAAERFFSGVAPEDDFPGGAGLGLPLAKAIAEAHGGQLEVLSQEGAGTAVTLRLPPGKASGESR